MNQTKNYWFIGLFVIVIEIFCPIHAKGAMRKTDIRKLNKALIFDLFMNYEISERNSNLSTIVDYIPGSDFKSFRSIRTESNMGGKDEMCNFEFNKNGTLNSMLYEIEGITYNYEFNYENKILESVSIGGNKKILFNYNKKGKLQTIKRLANGRSWECNFNYINGENKAEIKTFVTLDGKKIANPEEYFVTWNDQFKLTAYSLDIYAAKNIKYSRKGDCISFSFNSVRKDNNQSGWEYTFDNKGNWIDRKFKNEMFKRIIEYK